MWHGPCYPDDHLHSKPTSDPGSYLMTGRQDFLRRGNEKQQVNSGSSNVFPVNSSGAFHSQHSDLLPADADATQI